MTDTGSHDSDHSAALHSRSSRASADQHRSGFVAVVGRPNVGKSTLLNALVGEAVTTTSAKPQTTRRVIRGIITSQDAQIILVDTPGVHRPRTLLGERLNELVYRAWADVDAVVICLPADEAVGAGDMFILDKLRDARCPLVAVVTKTDRVVMKAVGLESLVSSWLLYFPTNTLAMIIASTWAGTGLVVVLFTIGIQSVPLHTVEAAKLDGANAWILFWRVVWPQLKYIRAVVIGTALANSLRTFDIVWVMTGGGPARSSETLAVTMYRESFLLNRYGSGSAVAVVLMILVASVSFFALRKGVNKGETL